MRDSNNLDEAVNLSEDDAVGQPPQDVGRTVPNLLDDDLGESMGGLIQPWIRVSAARHTNPLC